MILFPIALLWLVGVLIWAYRNNLTEIGPNGRRHWTGWRPRSPQRPPRDRRGGSAARAAGSRTAERSTRRERRVPRP